MVQEIVTYSILTATIIITIIKIFRFFAKNEGTACSNCAQAESGCKIADLKEKMNKKQKGLSFD